MQSKVETHRAAGPVPASQEFGPGCISVVTIDLGLVPVHVAVRGPLVVLSGLKIQ